jgi:hypothetical protein
MLNIHDSYPDYEIYLYSIDYNKNKLGQKQHPDLERAVERYHQEFQDIMRESNTIEEYTKRCLKIKEPIMEKKIFEQTLVHYCVSYLEYSDDDTPPLTDSQKTDKLIQVIEFCKELDNVYIEHTYNETNSLLILNIQKVLDISLPYCNHDVLLYNIESTISKDSFNKLKKTLLRDN